MIFIIGFVIFDNISPHNFASRATVYTAFIFGKPKPINKLKTILVHVPNIIFMYLFTHMCIFRFTELRICVIIIE